MLIFKSLMYITQYIYPTLTQDLFRRGDYIMSDQIDKDQRKETYR